MGFREWTRFSAFVADWFRWIEQPSIEVRIFPDEFEPSGEADLSVVGVPGSSGLVPGPSASVGFHDRPSLIMDNGSVNRGFIPADLRLPILNIGHGPRG